MILTQVTNFFFVSLGKIIDGSNADEAVDHYHRYKVSIIGISYGRLAFFAWFSPHIYSADC